MLAVGKSNWGPPSEGARSKLKAGPGIGRHTFLPPPQPLFDVGGQTLNCGDGTEIRDLKPVP